MSELLTAPNLNVAIPVAVIVVMVVTIYRYSTELFGSRRY